MTTTLSKESPEVIFLINCAGLGRFGDSFSIDPAETRSMIEVNMTSVVEVTSACIPHMPRGARIITLCSEAAYVAAYRLSVYAASKAFVRSYLDSLRMEVED
ncbi:MAG: SDR family NAD(P)-dependent oxidoreductase [Candidatus Methanomethylophilaceae archaeon]|nr:SDR family NAD(P)-dependent oxidoreductase [Candidatus Methanomethylophilaceae archaeon]